VNTLAGIPTHPLFAHAAVTLVPLTVIIALAAVFSTRARLRIGGVAPVLAVVTVIAVWLTRIAGEYLASQEGPGQAAAIHAHSEKADALMIWSVILAVTVLTVYVLTSARLAAVRSHIPALGSRPAFIVAGVAVAIASIGAMWAVIATGHSGAEMVWG